MNITELRYLVAIRKWGSVSAAAKQLYAAQPNVSKALKNLEEEYGIRIFERSSTGMIPTEQGRSFIQQAERVLQEVDRLDRDARHRPSHPGNVLLVSLPVGALDVDQVKADPRAGVHRSAAVHGPLHSDAPSAWRLPGIGVEQMS